MLNHTPNYIHILVELFMPNKIQIVDEQGYVKLFSKNPSQTNSTSEHPLRVYDIQTSYKNIKTPTLLFRPSFNCISIIKHGFMKITLDNSVKTVTKNSLLISRSGHISSTLDFSNDVEGYFLVYEDETLNSIFSKNEFLGLFSANPFITLNNADCKWLCELITLLEIELHKKNNSLDIVLPLFQAIYRKIFSLNNSVLKINDRSTEITFAFKELSYQHHIKQKNIDFYSKKLAVSNNYLTRCVKSSTGLTPKYILNECDVQQAKLLLQDHSKSLADITIELNYNDPSYFSRLFKKIAGITFTQFRQNQMHN